MQVFLLSLVWGWSTVRVMFHLSGLYCMCILISHGFKVHAPTVRQYAPSCHEWLDMTHHHRSTTFDHQALTRATMPLMPSKSQVEARKYPDRSHGLYCQQLQYIQ